MLSVLTLSTFALTGVDTPFMPPHGEAHVGRARVLCAELLSCLLRCSPQPPSPMLACDGVAIFLLRLPHYQHLYSLLCLFSYLLQLCRWVRRLLLCHRASVVMLVCAPLTASSSFWRR